MKGVAMSFSGAICRVIVLTAAVVCGNDDWKVTCSPSQICALKGSAVQIKCSYTYPSKINNKPTVVEKTFWFTEEMNGNYRDLKKEGSYSNRVDYQCINNACTMNISNLGKSDSNVYKFRFTTNHEFGKYTGLPGVHLSITDPQVQVNITGSTDHNQKRIELTCNNKCQLSHPVSYIWFNDEQKLNVNNQSYLLQTFNATGKYYCAIKGYESFPSPAVYAPNITLLSAIPSGEIAEGTAVTLNCSSDANPTAKYTWYRQNGAHVQKPRSETQRVFSSIQASDSGWYHCEADNDLGRITSRSIYINVLYRPKTCTVSVIPSGKVEEGLPVTLNCSSDANPAAEYTWYKENKILPNGSKQLYYFSAVSSKDRGNYSCKSENQYGHRNSSPRFLDVLYAPKLPSVSITSSGEIVEGSSVTVTCTSDANPAAEYKWYRENGQKCLESKNYLIFNYIESSDSGQYYCTAMNNRGEKTSTRINIDVKYAPRLPAVSLSPSGEIVEGISVTLTCRSDANPAAEYTWYKEGEESPKASEQTFTISDILYEHSGNYYCQVQNKMGRSNSTGSVIVVAGSLNLAVIGTTVFIFLIIIFLFVFFLLRKRRQSIPSPKQGESPNNIEQCQDNLSEPQEDFQYASVRFLKKQKDPVYANFKPAKTGKPNEEEEEEQGVEYATVKFASTTFQR
ncbi:B-cell receptor CD22-like isoform X1 [Girardinichthys multiradiatus]|uniref:B-cell receptor CD22-like isoform X1 n=1 Tax=Girardinichthys multiradiatus TaxID=208333 RepID=UPI001FAC3E64|nr:B-cell receptor CD22-like isoform X1 [Girardinichthys multiradiatus]